MRTIRLITLFSIIFLASCEDKVTISHESPDGYHTELNTKFNTLYDIRNWSRSGSCDSLSGLTGSGYYQLASCSNTGITYASLESVSRWELNPNLIYRVTFRIYLVDCLSGEGSIFWGIKGMMCGYEPCTTGFLNHIGNLYPMYYLVQSGYCSIQSSENYSACGESHDYMMEITSTHISVSIDDEPFTYYEFNEDCGDNYESFQILLWISSHSCQNVVWVDNIKIEKKIVSDL